MSTRGCPPLKISTIAHLITHFSEQMGNADFATNP